jgi:hypothetical protein
VFGPNATGFQQINPVHTKLDITIEDCMAIGRVIRKSFSQLLHYPGAGRMLCNIGMEDFASTVFDDKEAIPDSEREGWHGEEIHCCDELTMIAKKSSPEFTCLVGRR